jgi:hypothetical protein
LKWKWADSIRPFLLLNICGKSCGNFSNNPLDVHVFSVSGAFSLLLKQMQTYNPQQFIVPVGMRPNPLLQLQEPWEQALKICTLIIG